MAYGDFKDLTRRTTSDQILREKAFNITKSLKYDGYQRGLDLMVYKIFDKKSFRATFKKENSTNQELAKELHKPITKKFQKWRVYSPFIDNNWGADLADVQLIRKFNKGIRFILCVIDIFSKYAWASPLKDKKSITIINAFQKILEINCKPDKIWVIINSEFYNRSVKSWLEKNAIEMYSTHNERKSVVAERFIRTLKSRMYKYMTSIPQNVYIYKLDDIVNKYNNTYQAHIYVMESQAYILTLLKKIIRKFM